MFNGSDQKLADNPVAKLTQINTFSSHSLNSSSDYKTSWLFPSMTSPIKGEERKELRAFLHKWDWKLV